jgi:hypothetical protein
METLSSDSVVVIVAHGSNDISPAEWQFLVSNGASYKEFLGAKPMGGWGN